MLIRPSGQCCSRLLRNPPRIGKRPPGLRKLLYPMELLTGIMVGLYRSSTILAFKKMGSGEIVMGSLHDICVRFAPYEGVGLLEYVIGRLNR